MSKAEVATAPEPIHACDLFRGLEEMCEVDPRYLGRVVLDPKSGSRTMTVEDHWRDIEPLVLHEGVPRTIRIHFDTARNLLLHSWYVFRFQQVAEMHAYASVEYALRVRADFPPRSTPKLTRLLTIAVKQGWIRDDGFCHYRLAAERRVAAEEIEAAVTGKELESFKSDGRDYVRTLARLLPEFRNKLAHGTAMMRPSGKRTLALCCDLINQLFPSGGAG